MKQLLALLLALAVVTTTSVTPAVACVSKATLSDRQHSCCGERAVVSAPTGTCCFLSQPTNERTITESRNLITNDRHLDVATASHSLWWTVLDSSAHRRAS